MLYEDDVTDAVCAELERRGWSISQRLRSTEGGDDIIADRDGQRCVIECKGETSADSRTNRYGKPFDPVQVNSHVSRAMLRAMRVVSEGHLAGVAFPEERRHRIEVDKVRIAVERLGVVVCWGHRRRGGQDRVSRGRRRVAAPRPAAQRGRLRSKSGGSFTDAVPGRP